MSENTSESLRAEAAELNRKSEESFQRSDTDGFLSQWALDITASEKRLQAQLLEDGGTTIAPGLFSRNGELIEDARYVETRFGMAWVYRDDSGNSRWFNPSKAKTAEKRYVNNLKKGYYVGRIMVNAMVKMLGSGTGLSGAATARPAIVPKKNQDGSYQIVAVMDNGKDVADKIHPDLARAACDRPELHDDDIQHYDYCAWCGVRYIQIRDN